MGKFVQRKRGRYRVKSDISDKLWAFLRDSETNALFARPCEAFIALEKIDGKTSSRIF
jgi:hypothetical protein